MNGEKAKKFVKKHKVKIITGAGIVLGGVLLAITKKTCALPGKIPCPIADSNIRNISIPAEFAIGKVTDLWEEGDFLNSIVEEIKVNDLGALGKEFVKNGLITDGAEASVIIGFLKKE